MIQYRQLHIDHRQRICAIVLHISNNSKLVQSNQYKLFMELYIIKQL